MHLRPIAIHLPQFHPIAENDAWWGKGFTEWANVAKAKPLFKGHQQPKLPADLGFYDLRLDEVRMEQARLAKAAGFYGFCYYHYWFGGKRVLERPFNEVLQSGKPDFPFMLCWANENWTRTWDGSEQEILLQQHYSPEDDLAHIQALLPALKDKRYIRIDSKCVLAIYRSTALPHMAQTIKIWREEARRHGIELYLCRFESFVEAGADYLQPGFDAAIEFEPHASATVEFEKKSMRNQRKKPWTAAFLQTYGDDETKAFAKLRSKGLVVDYAAYVDYQIAQYRRPGYKQFPCVMPCWDNSARKKQNYLVFHNSLPMDYQRWLAFEAAKFRPWSKDENLFLSKNFLLTEAN